MSREDSLDQFTEANRAAWNEVMPLHRRAAKDSWDAAFSQPGYVCLDPEEQTLLREVGISGRDVAHLCCNNGVELLSLKNMGAGRCVGFDISDEAIQEAALRAELTGIGCEHVRTNVYDIGDAFNAQFDIVYISAGCLGWMPDLPRFFEVSAKLLRGGGGVFIHEMHPFSEILPFDDEEPAGDSPAVLQIVESYFRTEPYVEYGGLDYVGHSTHESTLPQYWFMHTLTDILSSLIESGLVIRHFSEYEKDVSADHQQVEDAHAGVPLSYMLVADKPR